MNKRFLILILLIVSSPVLYAQKTSDKTGMENERRQIQKELREIQQAYNAVKGKSKENFSQLAALHRKIELQEKYINNIGKEIRLINDDIYYSAIEIKRLKIQLDTLKAHYAHTVVYAYKNRTNYDYLNFIFSANSFNDAIRRIAYLKSYRNYRQQQMSDIVKTRELIAKRYEQQVDSKNQKTTALETRSSEYEILEKQQTEKDSVATLLKSQAGDLRKQIDIKKKRDRELQSSIAAVVRKEIADAKRIAQEEARKKAAADAKARADALARQAAIEEERRRTALAEAGKKEVPINTPEPSNEVAVNPAPLRKMTKVNPNTAAPNGVPSGNAVVTKARPISTPPASPPPENKTPAGGYLNYQASDIALNSNFAQNRGRLPRPVEGVVTLGFGRYKIEGVGPDIVGDNPGITYTTAVGAPVRAVFDGEVASVSKVGGMLFIVLRHGKYFTAYSNLASVNVNKGARVGRGQVIGTVGADEETGSGKLDFILMIEERNVDPRGWLM